MISISNFKLLAELQNELDGEKKKLEVLKSSTHEEMCKRASNLFDRFKVYFEVQKFDITTRKEVMRNVFVARYENSNIIGYVYDDAHEVFLDLEEVYSYRFVVVPKVGEYTEMGRKVPEKDQLTNDIADLYKKISKVKATISSYEKKNFVFALNQSDKLTLIGNEEVVLQKLFKP